MNKLIKYGAIALVAVLAIYGVLHARSVTTIGDASTSFTDGLIVGGGTYTVNPALTVIGNQAISGSIYYQGSINASSTLTSFSGTVALSSTTPCAIQSPAATSSLAFGSLQITTPTTTASTWVMATSSTAFATTTALVTEVIGSGGYGSITWDAGASNSLMAPSTWVVFGASNYGVPSSGIVVSGRCQAQFITL